MEQEINLIMYEQFCKERFAGFDGRFDAIGARLDRQDEKLEGLSVAVAGIQSTLDNGISGTVKNMRTMFISIIGALGDGVLTFLIWTLQQLLTGK